MKGIDDFLMWLGIGIALMAILIVLFGRGPLEFSQTQQPTSLQPRAITTIPTENLSITLPSGAILVGRIERESWRIIRFDNINASYHAGEVLKSLSDRRIYNGLLFGSNKVEMTVNIDTNKTIGAFLSFFVNNTNGYGALIIKVNDIIINDKKLPIGEHIFFLNNSILREKNTIEIFATSSSWKLWAPTVYELRNVKFVSQELFAKRSNYTFNIYEDEFKNLRKDKKAELSLDLRERRGKLKIEINSNEIFNNEVEKSRKTIYFDQSLLKKEINEIEFVALDGAFEGFAELKFYFNVFDELKAEKSFEISQYEYSQLYRNPGRIVFTIEDVLSQGGLSVIVRDAYGKETTIAYDIPRKGFYNYTLHAIECSPGVNRVIIKSVDNAKFYVKDINILLE
ncbi:MAG: hypothetical protein QXJ25_01330 [Candidatus Aenigmatarchaeota archaeon]